MYTSSAHGPLLYLLDQRLTAVDFRTAIYPLSSSAMAWAELLSSRCVAGFMISKSLLMHTKAIRTLDEQGFRRRFLDLIVAIIFLGTPHFVSVGKVEEKQFCQILKADLKSVTRRTINKRGLTAIAAANMAFDEWKSLIPILSGYETRETKLHGPLFFRGKDVVRSVNVVFPSSLRE